MNNKKQKFIIMAESKLDLKDIIDGKEIDIVDEKGYHAFCRETLGLSQSDYELTPILKKQKKAELTLWGTFKLYFKKVIPIIKEDAQLEMPLKENTKALDAFYLILKIPPKKPSSHLESLIRGSTVTDTEHSFKAFKQKLFCFEEKKRYFSFWLSLFLLLLSVFLLAAEQYGFVTLLIHSLLAIKLFNLLIIAIIVITLAVFYRDLFEKAWYEIRPLNKVGNDQSPKRTWGIPGVNCTFLLVFMLPLFLGIWMTFQPAFFAAIGISTYSIFTGTVISMFAYASGECIRGLVENPQIQSQCEQFNEKYLRENRSFIILEKQVSIEKEVKEEVKEVKEVEEVKVNNVPLDPTKIKKGQLFLLTKDRALPVRGKVLGKLKKEEKTESGEYYIEKTLFDLDQKSLNGESGDKSFEPGTLFSAGVKNTSNDALVVEALESGQGLVSKFEKMDQSIRSHEKNDFIGVWGKVFTTILFLALIFTVFIWVVWGNPAMLFPMLVMSIVSVITRVFPATLSSIFLGTVVLVSKFLGDFKFDIDINTLYNIFLGLSAISMVFTDMTGTLTTFSDVECITWEKGLEELKKKKLFQYLFTLENEMKGSESCNSYPHKIKKYIQKKTKLSLEALLLETDEKYKVEAGSGGGKITLSDGSILWVGKQKYFEELLPKNDFYKDTKSEENKSVSIIAYQESAKALIKKVGQIQFKERRWLPFSTDLIAYFIQCKKKVVVLTGADSAVAKKMYDKQVKKLKQFFSGANIKQYFDIQSDCTGSGKGDYVKNNSKHSFGKTIGMGDQYNDTDLLKNVDIPIIVSQEPSVLSSELIAILVKNPKAAYQLMRVVAKTKQVQTLCVVALLLVFLASVFMATGFMQIWFGIKITFSMLTLFTHLGFFGVSLVSAVGIGYLYRSIKSLVDIVSQTSPVESNAMLGEAVDLPVPKEDKRKDTPQLSNHL